MRTSPTLFDQDTLPRGPVVLSRYRAELIHALLERVKGSVRVSAQDVEIAQQWLSGE